MLKSVKIVQEQGLNTKSVHSGTQVNKDFPGVNTPIHSSSSFYMYFDRASPDAYPRYLNTPNHKAVAEKLAALENAKYSYITASGMAAITTAIMSSVKPGDHIIVQKEIYGGSYNFIERELKKYQIEISWLSINEIESLDSQIKDNTRIVYIETPSNPLLALVDLEAIVQCCQKHNLISIVDNTFATPINQNPLEIGLDIVVHSGSKYLCGHSDLVCGAILFNKEELVKPIYSHLINHGATLDSIALYQLERSIKTLALRVERHNSNALAVAEFLEEQKQIIKVNYPGLKSSPYHQIAQKQMRGFGGVLSFELDGDLETSKKFINKLKIISSALSLGGVESLICIPRLSSHSKMTTAERTEAGVKDSLIRLSVGIEDLNDLTNDLKQALS